MKLTPIKFDGFRLRDADGEIICSPSYWHEGRMAELVRLTNAAADLEEACKAARRHLKAYEHNAAFAILRAALKMKGE